MFISFSLLSLGVFLYSLLFLWVFYRKVFIVGVYPYIYIGAAVRLLPWPRRFLGGDVGLTRLRDRMVGAVRGYVAGSAFVDRGLGESVCVADERMIAGFLRGRFGAVDWRVVELFTQGEVLSDPRGGGSMQRVEDDE